MSEDNIYHFVWEDYPEKSFLKYQDKDGDYEIIYSIYKEIFLYAPKDQQQYYWSARSRVTGASVRVPYCYKTLEQAKEEAEKRVTNFLNYAKVMHDFFHRGD